METGAFRISSTGLWLLRGVFRTQSNIEDEAYCKNIEQRLAVNYICKNSILDAWLGSECAFDY